MSEELNITIITIFIKEPLQTKGIIVRYTHGVAAQMRTYITILRPLKGRYILFARRLAMAERDLEAEEEEAIGKK